MCSSSIKEAQVALHTHNDPEDVGGYVSVRLQVCDELAAEVPKLEMPVRSMPPGIAYQITPDELMLDGNARRNLATFVTTWMEPEAERLMAECEPKTMIDK